MEGLEESSKCDKEHSDKGSCGRCLFCNVGGVEGEDKQGDVVDRLFRIGSGGSRDVIGKVEGLEKELYAFFMLRKVLGLSPDFLESLLVKCGSPSEWKIRLCRMCKRLFKEAEQLWDRMSELQRAYQKVTFEIKDTLINSISTEEVETVNKVADNEREKKAWPLRELETCRISEGIRARFFTDLQGDDTAVIEEAHAQVPVLSAGTIGAQGTSGKLNGLVWNERGIPYLTLADFEKKMRELVDVVDAVKDRVSEPSTAGPLLSETNPSGPSGTLGERLAANLNEAPEGSTGHSGGTGGTAISNGNDKSRNSLSEEEESESLIRIVHNNKLMETEVKEEDTDVLPDVTNVLHVSFNETMDVVGDESNDPLGSNEDDANYIPETDANATTPVVQGTRTSHNSTRKKNRLNSLKVKVLRPGPNAFNCSKCLGTFDTRRACLIHILRDHYGEDLSFHCHVCADKFAHYHLLKEHVHSSHGKTETAYDDDFTGDSDSSVGKDKASKDPVGTIENSSGIPIFKCPVVECSDMFTNKRDLQKHTSTVHKTRRKSIKKAVKYVEPPGFVCKLCAERNIEYRAENSDILDIHLKKMHNQTTKMRTTIIGKRRLQPAGSNSKQVAMVCPDCEKILPSSEELAKHLKNPENKCPECPQHFKFQIDLRRHIDINHYNRNFQCPFCDKCFTLLTVYQKHVNDHKDFDTQECEVCHSRFMGSRPLAQHIRHAHPEFSQDESGRSKAQNPQIFGL